MSELKTITDAVDGDADIDADDPEAVRLMIALLYFHDYEAPNSRLLRGPRVVISQRGPRKTNSGTQDVWEGFTVQES